MEVANFTNSVRTLSAKYIDDKNIGIKSARSRIEQEYDLYSTAILNQANDVKTGGYNTLYLSEQKYGDDVIEYKQIITNTEDIVITDLVYGIGNQNYCLYINVPQSIVSDTKTTCEFVLASQIDKINNTFFEIEFLDSRYCRLCHKVNYDIFYLTVNSDLNVFFQNKENKLTGLSAIDEFVFSYIIDKEKDKFSLYKPISGSNYNLSVSGAKFTLLKSASATFLPFNSSNTLRIQYNNRILNVDPKINTSWVSYSDVNSLEIDTSKSAFKNKNNYLASSQYSFLTGDDIELNVLPLKNQLTKEGISQRGNYLLNIPNKLYPQTDLRDYEKIHIGSKSEKGLNDIALTYTFYNTEFSFKPDEYNFFKTPESLYPYKQININDTLFAVNGSLGGDSPHSSDKIYTQNINTNSSNDGMYLCTWLSGGSEYAPGIWVDRYYNNTKITPIEALTSTAMKLYDFTSNVEENIETNQILDLYFDVRSDLIIEPSREYIYQRLGKEYINSFIKHLDNSIIFDTLSTRTSRGSIDVLTEKTDIYLFNNRYHYSYIDKNVSSFTFSFWLQADWNQPFGYQLAGNYSNRGFGIFNDETITPFIFVPYENNIFVYNTNFIQINKIDFGSKVKHIIRINPLDDIYVITTGRPGATNLSVDQGSVNIIHKLKSNGTAFDADVLAEIIDYINIINTETDIYFLLDTSGNVAIYNILSETITNTKVAIPAERGVDFEIKSLGFDQDGNLVGFRGEKCLKYNDREHIFINRNNLLVKETNDHTLRTILLSSASTIYDFTIDSNENFYVLHNKFLTKYNGQRDLLFKYKFGEEFTPLAVDIVREYTEEGLRQYPIVLLSDNSKNLHIGSLEDDTGLLISRLQIEDVKGDFKNFCADEVIYNYYNLTNYSFFLKNNQQSNQLRFRIDIPNKYNNRDKLNNIISFDISKLSIGKHHFAYRLDTINGNISLFVDGKRYTNMTFDPGEYALNNTLYNVFNVGAGTYFNGTLINNYIKQTDRYFCRGAVVEQPRLYDTAIDDVDVKFLNLQNRKFQELSVSLPCGERNQIEQIQRLYKWQLPGSKSNNINVRIKNNLLNNDDINNTLKEIIRREIQSSLPAAIKINNITFEGYK